jgi:hypothetical protein
MRKKEPIIYKKYILKLLLNVVIGRIEALILSESKFFCVPVSKKSAAYKLSHVCFVKH